jgi:hypothetical protein
MFWIGSISKELEEVLKEPLEKKKQADEQIEKIQKEAITYFKSLTHLKPEVRLSLMEGYFTLAHYAYDIQKLFTDEYEKLAIEKGIQEEFIDLFNAFISNYIEYREYSNYEEVSAISIAENWAELVEDLFNRDPKTRGKYQSRDVKNLLAYYQDSPFINYNASKEEIKALAESQYDLVLECTINIEQSEFKNDW